MKLNRPNAGKRVEDLMKQNADIESDSLFARREEEKEAKRMRDYQDPAYGKAMAALLKGEAPPPVRARTRR